MNRSYPVFAYGHDFGNSENCGVLTAQSGRIERRLPSVTAIGSWKTVEATAAGMGKSVRDILAPAHYVLEYDDNGRRIEKVVGQKVYDDGSQPTFTNGDSSRYWVNNYSLEFLMVSSASVLSQREYGLHVVTGLPISIYLEDASNRLRVEHALKGTHVFWFNGEQRTLHVESVKVIMEGAGALIAWGSNDEVLQGVIDIGGHTTDLYVANGMKPQASNSKGFSKGVIKASERFSALFREACNTTLPVNVCNQLLLQHVSGKPYKGINDKFGNRVPVDRVHALLAIAIREIGQEIAGEVIRLWDSILSQVDVVLIVGGGAHYFAEEIQARIPKATVPYVPEMANCYGYDMLAEAITEQVAAYGA